MQIQIDLVSFVFKFFVYSSIPPPPKKKDSSFTRNFTCNNHTHQAKLPSLFVNSSLSAFCAYNSPNRIISLYEFAINLVNFGSLSVIWMELHSIECVPSSDLTDEDEIHHHRPHQFPSISKPHNNCNNNNTSLASVINPGTTSVHELLECPVCTNSMYPPIHQVCSFFWNWFDGFLYLLLFFFFSLSGFVIIFMFCLFHPFLIVLMHFWRFIIGI